MKKFLILVSLLLVNGPQAQLEAGILGTIEKDAKKTVKKAKKIVKKVEKELPGKGDIKK